MILNLRSAGGNALSILTSDAMNRATSFVMYALVARHLGAQDFGQLSLAFSLFYMFQVFAIAGLKVLIIRQVAKDRSQTNLPPAGARLSHRYQQLLQALPSRLEVQLQRLCSQA